MFRLRYVFSVLGICVMMIASITNAQQANLDINTPAIAALQSAMQARHAQLLPWYASGAIGIRNDGTLELRDANAIPLAQRQQAVAVVAAENNDRAALYREIARANGNPQWEDQIRQTFAKRWIDKAQAGWYVQGPSGWVKK